MKKAIYISYDGMTDPLGQSQVIPYLIGLTQSGIKFWLISFEKPERYQKSGGDIHEMLDNNGITWIPLSYTANPPVISTLIDLFKMRRETFRLIKNNQIHIVHCRSYISALCGLWAKRRMNTKFIFDMRGFWADERIDGGIWNLSNPIYRLIYGFFKRMEKKFLREADAIVSLTENAKSEILSWPDFSNLKINVIPCCADLNLFSQQTIQRSDLNKLRNEIGISENQFVLTYLGSIGTWYMLKEMLLLFSILLEQKPDAVFLIISADNPQLVLAEAQKSFPELNPQKLIIRRAERNEVPQWAALSDVSVFFIKPLYSKKASSPTKMAELMGLGIPLICNSGVGDVEDILKKSGRGIAINSFEPEYLREKLKELDNLISIDPTQSVKCVQEFFALEEGVLRYEKIYENLYS